MGETVILTEEQARAKWCPWVRHVNAEMQACGNSMPFSDGVRGMGPTANCIASKCMAWRWGWEQEQLPPERITKEYAQLVPSDHGYCGLAGKIG